MNVPAEIAKQIRRLAQKAVKVEGDLRMTAFTPTFPPFDLPVSVGSWFSKDGEEVRSPSLFKIEAPTTKKWDL